MWYAVIMMQLLRQLKEAATKGLVKNLEVINPKHDPSQSYILTTLHPHTTQKTQVRLMTHIETIYDLPVGISNSNDEGQIYLTIQIPRLSQPDLDFMQVQQP